MPSGGAGDHAIGIRPARADDAAALTALAHRAKASWGYPAEWMAAWREALTLTPEYIARHRVGVAEAGGEPLGFYALEAREGPGARWSLGHLWVEPAWQGLGVGRALFEHAADAARAAGAAGLEIESDPRAEPFYLRLGARRAGSVPAPAPGDADRVLPVLVYDWPAR